MNTYNITALSEHPELFDSAASWFHSKWGVPIEEYLKSMNACQISSSGVPAWYVLLDTHGNIIAGLGIIENDFHKRPDLTPNLCALYVEEAYRNQGIARLLMDYACKELFSHGIETAYLITSHTYFYERCGWSFYGMIEENDGDLIRMYQRTT